MRLDHAFTVPVSVERAWETLLDLPRIVPCMPGATLTGVEGDSFTGTVKVKLGPILLTYQGKGRFVERDEAARRVIVEASGRDTRSAGTAAATVTAVLVPDGGQTRVDVGADVTVTGRPAQFGRGMIADVSAKLIGQFADCLAQTLAEDVPAGLTRSTGSPATTAGAQQPAPVAVRQREEPVATARAVRPVDLVRVAGGTPTARRVATYAVVGLLFVAVMWLLRRVRRGNT